MWTSRLFLFVGLLALSGCTGGLSVRETAAVRDSTKVLLIAGPDSHGWGSHEHIAGLEVLSAALRQSGLGIDTVICRGEWPDDRAIFQGVRCVVLYCDGGKNHLLGGHLEQLAALSDRGVGVVCLHYALEPQDDTMGGEFLDCLGGYFAPNWSVNPTWTPRGVRMAEHPVTRGVRPIEITDEWYFHMKFRDGMTGITPLVSALPSEDLLSTEDTPRMGNPVLREELRRGELQHLAWVCENPDNSRGFGFTGGHIYRNWSDGDFRRLVLNGIVWAAGLDVPQGGVVSEDPLIVKYKTLLQAVSRGDAADVERHIQNGAEFDTPSSSGWTPLHHAVLRKKADVVKVLLEHGVDVNSATGKEAGCLHFCAERNYLDLAELLLEKGADPGLKRHDGWTPLHIASARNRLDMARLLVKNGADVNARSVRGGTPLHEAAASAERELIEFLLKNGVDPDIPDEDGRTALDCAVELGNKAAVGILGTP